MPPLPVLLVGYGFRGRHWAETCARRSDLALSGVVDPSPSAREAAGAAGLPTWATLEEALERGGSEAAIVASPAADLRDTPGGWHADIQLGWSDGARGRYEQTDGADSFRTRELVLGTRGFILAGTTRAVVVGRRARRFRWPANSSTDDRLLDALLRAIGGAETDLGVADNLATIALVEAVIRSAATRRPVPLSEILPRVGVRSEDDGGA